MADARLRKLEREALGSGSPDDRARYLLERTRLAPFSFPTLSCGLCHGTGWVDRPAAKPHDHGLGPCEKDCLASFPCPCENEPLPARENLRLAAYLGSEAAQLATRDDWGYSDHLGGICHCCLCAQDDDVVDWLKLLDCWGKAPLVRVAIAAARETLPRMAVMSRSGRYLPSSALALRMVAANPPERAGLIGAVERIVSGLNDRVAAAELWVVTLDDDHAERCLRENLEARSRIPFVELVERLLAAAGTAEGWHASAVESVTWSLRTLTNLDSGCEGERTARGGELLRAAVRREVALWALGEGDPVADRLKKGDRWPG